MGKIVKYCGVCDESFTEKFSFCPNCAAELDAYEMNPLMAESAKVEPVKVSEPANDITVEKVTAPIAEPPKTQPEAPISEPAPPVFLSNLENNNDEILEIDEEEVEEPIVTAPAVVVPAVAAKNVEEIPAVAKITEEVKPATQEVEKIYQPVAKQSVEDYQQTYNANHFTPAKSSSSSNQRSSAAPSDNDGYYNITFVDQKDGGKRNILLLGAAVLVLGISVLSVIGSIYNADAFVSALDEDLNSVVFVPFDEPVDLIEEEPPPPQKKPDDAGGGGGGNNDPNPVSKGRLANQTEKPMMAPSHTMDKVTNPTIPVEMSTKGNKKFPPSDEKYGDPTSKYTVGSDGPGSGGGQGVGRGGGQGPGSGPGIGPGSGGGYGGGNRGGSPGDDDDPPPARPTGPTTALNITSKPRANYTDAARQAQVQGTVTLRVTFLASGQIGSISAVNGLPNGLTEQAIAAARGIRFEPAQKNGVKQTVQRQVQYTFTLY